MMQMNPVLTIALPLILAFTKIMYRRIANLFLVLGSLLNVLVVFFIKEGQYLMGGVCAALRDRSSSGRLCFI